MSRVCFAWDDAPGLCPRCLWPHLLQARLVESYVVHDRDEPSERCTYDIVRSMWGRPILPFLPTMVVCNQRLVYKRERTSPLCDARTRAQKKNNKKKMSIFQKKMSIFIACAPRLPTRQTRHKKLLHLCLRLRKYLQNKMFLVHTYKIYIFSVIVLPTSFTKAW